uniref:(northern house mosquito) hypothetical protein n=1 Tax=Culex pipiens TaxID=7175 RepID=A0A8D8F5Y3_CULPI
MSFGNRLLVLVFHLVRLPLLQRLVRRLPQLNQRRPRRSYDHRIRSTQCIVLLEATHCPHRMIRTSSCLRLELQPTFQRYIMVTSLHRSYRISGHTILPDRTNHRLCSLPLELTR